MGTLLLRGGQLIGLLGIVLMVTSAVARVQGMYELGGYAAGTLMVGSIGAVSVGCFLLLLSIAQRREA